MSGDHSECQPVDLRWDAAVEWLLNSRYCSDDAGPLFWAFYDEIITEDELRSESVDEVDGDGLPRSIWDVINERRDAPQIVWREVPPEFGSAMPNGSCNAEVHGVACGFPRRSDGTCGNAHPAPPGWTAAPTTEATS